MTQIYSTHAPWHHHRDGLVRPKASHVACKLCPSTPKYDITATRQPKTDLDTKQQMAVGVFQLSLSALQLFDSLLLSLQHSDVVHRGLQNGPLIPAHVSEVGRRQRSTVSQLTIWPADWYSKGFFMAFKALKASVRTLMNSQIAKCTAFNYKPELKTTTAAKDSRIVWFGDEGAQLFDAVVNVESPSAFNWKRAELERPVTFVTEGSLRTDE